MQNFILSSKMTLVLGIELLEAYKIAYEVYVVELITPTAWLPACLAARQGLPIRHESC